MKATTMTTTRAALLAAGAFLAGALAMQLGGSPAEAQQRGATRSANTTVTHTARVVNTIVPSAQGDKVLGVHGFPNSSVFLVHTKDSVTVWERRGDGLAKLLEVELLDDVEDIVFLEDGQTFILQSDDGAIVYRVEAVITQN